MNLLIVEDDTAFRNFLRVWIAEQAGKEMPDAFLLMAFSNIRADRLPLYIDAVLRELHLHSPASEAMAFRRNRDASTAQAA
ncbi:MAG TPA: hypothetical protein VFZ08_04475 [Terriglobia bacterium]|nr:hypothetical protein [Terriglobia bacterium]